MKDFISNIRYENGNLCGCTTQGTSCGIGSI